MKKLMFVLVAGVVACVMTACNGICGCSECGNDSIPTDSVDSIVASDSVAVDSLVK